MSAWYDSNGNQKLCLSDNYYTTTSSILQDEFKNSIGVTSQFVTYNSAQIATLFGFNSLTDSEKISYKLDKQIDSTSSYNLEYKSEYLQYNNKYVYINYNYGGLTSNYLNTVSHFILYSNDLNIYNYLTIDSSGYYNYFGNKLLTDINSPDNNYYKIKYITAQNRFCIENNSGTDDFKIFNDTTFIYALNFIVSEYSLPSSNQLSDDLYSESLITVPGYGPYPFSYIMSGGVSSIQVILEDLKNVLTNINKCFNDSNNYFNNINQIFEYIKIEGNSLTGLFENVNYINNFMFLSKGIQMTDTTSNNFSKMFYKCSNLTAIDLSNLDLTNTINISNMFSNCNKLNNITFKSDLNINIFNNNVSYLFNNCNLLEYIYKKKASQSSNEPFTYIFPIITDVVDISNLNISYMFNGCNNLKQDLSPVIEYYSKLLNENKSFNQYKNAFNDVYKNITRNELKSLLRSSSTFLNNNYITPPTFIKNYLSNKWFNIYPDNNVLLSIGFNEFFTIQNESDMQTLISSESDYVYQISHTSNKNTYYISDVRLHNSSSSGINYFKEINTTNGIFKSNNKNYVEIIKTLKQIINFGNIRNLSYLFYQIDFTTNSLSLSQTQTSYYWYINYDDITMIQNIYPGYDNSNSGSFIFLEENSVTDFTSMFESSNIGDTGVRVINGILEPSSRTLNLENMFYKCKNLNLGRNSGTSMDPFIINIFTNIELNNSDTQLDKMFLFSTQDDTLDTSNYNNNDQDNINTWINHNGSSSYLANILLYILNNNSAFTSLTSSTSSTVSELVAQKLLSAGFYFSNSSFTSVQTKFNKLIMQYINIIYSNTNQNIKYGNIHLFLKNLNDFSNLFAEKNINSLNEKDSTWTTLDVSNVVDFTECFKGCSFSQSPVILDWQFNSTEQVDLTSMFENCTNLKTLELTNLTTVDNMTNMFSGCSSLETLNLQKLSTVSDMTSAFQNCSSLETLTLDNLTTITIDDTNGSPFLGCTNLTTLILSGVTSFTSNVFSGLIHITDVNLQGLINQDLKSAFAGCYKLTSLNLHNLTNAYMRNAFLGCSSLDTLDLTNLTSVINMNNTFQNCTTLETLDLSSLTTVSDMTYAFYDCSNLQTLILSSLKTVPYMTNTFSGCTSLNNLNLDSLENIITNQKVDASPFYNCTSLEILYLPAVTGFTSNVFSGLEHITDINLKGLINHDMTSAFQNCKNLNTLDLSSLITAPNMSYAFNGCTSLTSLDLDSLENIYTGQNGIPQNSPFNNCTSLKILHLPALQTVSAWVFSSAHGYPKYFTEIHLPNLTGGEEGGFISAFEDCTTLETLDLSNLTTVSNMTSAFKNCTNLTSLNLNNLTRIETTQWSAPYELDSSPFQGCSNLETLNLEQVTFFSGYVFSKLTNFTEITLPLLTTQDMTRAFEGCTGLTKLSLPMLRVASKMSYAFSGCTSLNNLNLGSLQQINTNESGFSTPSPFTNCTNLTSLDLPNVRNFSSGVFENLPNLTEIKLGALVTQDMTRAFYGCSGLTSIYLPQLYNGSNMTRAFEGCTGLTNLALNNLFSAGNMSYAFYGCTGLTSLDLNNLDTADDTLTSTFYNCKILTSPPTGPAQKSGISSYMNWIYKPILFDMLEKIFQNKVSSGSWVIPIRSINAANFAKTFEYSEQMVTGFIDRNSLYFYDTIYNMLFYNSMSYDMTIDITKEWGDTKPSFELLGRKYYIQSTTLFWDTIAKWIIIYINPGKDQTYENGLSNDYLLWPKELIIYFGEEVKTPQSKGNGPFRINGSGEGGGVNYYLDHGSYKDVKYHPDSEGPSFRLNGNTLIIDFTSPLKRYGIGNPLSLNQTNVDHRASQQGLSGFSLPIKVPDTISNAIKTYKSNFSNKEIWFDINLRNTWNSGGFEKVRPEATTTQQSDEPYEITNPVIFKFE